ncbi:hypothetical protein PIB30_062684 [Stylosanthes scabra]|uniref:Putative plant transposon protein domain-containing protein n=1 Tax=Stylosanthes scabra TaxID=79078 RepID=A0ABU6VK68_9FABA|nr:hypothetical protein [Stylosanthes scabra]
MASSSHTSKRKKGKQAILDDDDENHDSYRFFTNFHEKFFEKYVASKAIIPSTKFKLQKGQYRDIKKQILMRGWVKLGKPRKNISATLVREFYANARKNPDVEDSREFRTFVRGVSFGFSKERIRAILELKGPLDSETSFNVRKLRANRDTYAILRDICVEGAVWETGAHMNPLKLRRQDLTPLASGWHDFIIHNIKPTSNQSEVTIGRAVLIHYIITSQEVEVEEIIEDTMTSIISKLHLSKPPLAFPNVIARLLEESGVDYNALDSDDKYQSQHHFEEEQPAGEATFEAAYGPQNYGWGQLHEDMTTLKANQQEFYDSILAQQSQYGLRLTDIETRQNTIWAEQHKFHQEMREYHEQQQNQFKKMQEEQAQLQRDFSNYRKNFSTHMSRTHKSFEEQGKQMEEINDLLSQNTWHTKSHQMYSNWALQQMNPALIPILPRHIPFRIQSNVNENRPMFDGMLRPWPVGGESSAAAAAAPPQQAPPQQAPSEANAPRRENPDSDDE